MLRAFSKELERLAGDPQERFGDKVRAILPEQTHPEAVPLAQELILRLPAMLMELRSWYERVDVPMELRRLHGVTLTYVYQARDLMPEEPYGLFGYLDDAYLVGSVYLLTLQQLMARGLVPTPEVSGEIPRLARRLETARRLLPEGTARLDAMVTDFMRGKMSAFGALMDAAEKNPPDRAR